MSKISLLNGGGGGGGTDILTITGNDAIPTPPDGAGNLNLIGLGQLQVTNTGANTLSISDGTSRYVLITNDDNPHTIVTYPLLFDTAVAFSGTIVGARADYSAAMSVNFEALGRNDGGGAVLVNNISLALGPISDGIGTAYGVSASGNDILISVTGEAATTWNWTLILNKLTEAV